MIYHVRYVIAGIIILLGLVHLCFLFVAGQFTIDELWFTGSGMAIIFSGFLNIAAIINCRQRWLNYLSLLVNSVMFGLFCLSMSVMSGPQIYIALVLYLAAILLSLVQVRKNRRSQGGYTHFEKVNHVSEPLSNTESIPMLRIFDKMKAEEFYCGWLGFSIDWEHRFDEKAPVYMQVSKAGIRIHLTEHHGDCSPGGKIFIAANGIREYHQQLMDKGYPFNHPGLGTAIWGTVEFTALDPFGNQLLFTEHKKD